MLVVIFRREQTEAASAIVDSFFYALAIAAFKGQTGVGGNESNELLVEAIVKATFIHSGRSRHGSTVMANFLGYCGSSGTIANATLKEFSM